MIRLMCGDARTQIVSIVIPRLFGDVDLCDLTWSIKVVNPKGVTDVCTPYGDVQCTDDEIIVDWLICGVATAAPGTTNFEVIGVDETVDGHPIVWQSGIGNLLVSECLNASPSGDQGEQLSSLDKLIIYVNGELTNVIAAGEAASDAAKRANDAAERAEKAVDNIGEVTIGIASKEKLGIIRVGENLKIDENGVLSVDTATAVEQDNTRPVTSAAVHTELGNIEALLANI